MFKKVFFIILCGCFFNSYSMFIFNNNTDNTIVVRIDLSGGEFKRELILRKNQANFTFLQYCKKEENKVIVCVWKQSDYMEGKEPYSWCLNLKPVEVIELKESKARLYLYTAKI